MNAPALLIASPSVWDDAVFPAEKIWNPYCWFGNVRGAKALAKGALGLNFLPRGILESAFL
jgi:hypothetical protein